MKFISPKRFTILVRDSWIDNIKHVAANIRSVNGVSVLDVADILGIIYIEVKYLEPKTVFKKILKLKGVQSIEQS